MRRRTPENPPSETVGEKVRSRATRQDRNAATWLCLLRATKPNGWYPFDFVEEVGA